MKDKYTPIMNDKIKDNFFSYVDTIDIPQIDYIAIGIQDTISKHSISLMSRPEWQRIFVENQYASFDPVRRASLDTKRKFIPFDEVDHLSSLGKEIMYQRSLVGIKNGVLIIDRQPTFNFILTLGTDYTKFNGFNCINKHYKEIILAKKELLSIIFEDIDLLKK